MTSAGIAAVAIGGVVLIGGLIARRVTRRANPPSIDSAFAAAPGALDPRPPIPVDFNTIPPIPEGGSTLSAEWWIAMRHLSSRHEETFLSLVAVLAIVGVVVGVATVNIVLSVMTGFEVDLRDKILGANAHIVVLRYGGLVDDPDDVIAKIDTIDEVLAAAPFTYSEAMIRTPIATTGIILKGVDPARTGEVTAVRHDLVRGPEGTVDTPEAKAALFARMTEPCPATRPAIVTPSAIDIPEGIDAPQPDEAPLPCILLGGDLAQQLSVDPGDKVQVIDPLGGGTGIMGMPVPRVREFRVLGIYDSGMYEYDTKWTYVLNTDAQSFLDIGHAVTGIEIKVTDIDNVVAISDAIEAKLMYPYYTRHWKELNQPLFEALELEKVVMGLILFLIVGVAALLIVTTLIMVVITKGREIAILKAMGASEGVILRIFVIEGSVIGFLGTTVGTALGLLGCAFLDWYQYPLATDVYFLSHLPVVVEYDNVAIIAVAAFAICFLATWYPAWRAASLDPVDGLRYE